MFRPANPLHAPKRLLRGRRYHIPHRRPDSPSGRNRQTLTFFFEGRSGTFPARAYTDPEAEQKGVVPASRYAELAKAYLELEQAYAAAMLKCGREKQLEDTLAETRNILAGILTSLSWRVTAPLRKLMEIIRRR